MKVFCIKQNENKKIVFYQFKTNFSFFSFFKIKLRIHHLQMKSVAHHNKRKVANSKKQVIFEEKSVLPEVIPDTVEVSRIPNSYKSSSKKTTKSSLKKEPLVSLKSEIKIDPPIFEETKVHIYRSLASITDSIDIKSFAFKDGLPASDVDTNIALTTDEIAIVAKIFKNFGTGAVSGFTTTHNIARLISDNRDISETPIGYIFRVEDCIICMGWVLKEQVPSNDTLEPTKVYSYTSFYDLTKPTLNPVFVLDSNPVFDTLDETGRSYFYGSTLRNDTITYSIGSRTLTLNPIANAKSAFVCNCYPIKQGVNPITGFGVVTQAQT